MIAIEDICTKKCENFNGIDKKSFQKILDLREKSKGDKIYDDGKIDKECFVIAKNLVKLGLN